jgi:TPR repeat protein
MRKSKERKKQVVHEWDEDSGDIEEVHEEVSEEEDNVSDNNNAAPLTNKNKDNDKDKKLKKKKSYDRLGLGRRTQSASQGLMLRMSGKKKEKKNKVDESRLCQSESAGVGARSAPSSSSARTEPAVASSSSASSFQTQQEDENSAYHENLWSPPSSLKEAIRAMSRRAETENADEIELWMSDAIDRRDGDRHADALDSFANAAELGSVEALLAIGDYYAHGIDDGDVFVPQNFELASQYYSMACKRGGDSEIARLKAGVCSLHLAGIGQEMLYDIKAMKPWQKQRCGGTDAHRAHELGAFRMFLRAASRGHAPCMHLLSLCFYYGIGTERDHEKTLDWWKQGAAQGDIQAKAELGGAYLCGTGIAQDPKRAVELLCEAATKGHGGAQIVYAYCLGKGIGIARNNTAAKQWARAAKQQGVSFKREPFLQLRLPFIPPNGRWPVNKQGERMSSEDAIAKQKRQKKAKRRAQQEAVALNVLMITAYVLFAFLGGS